MERVGALTEQLKTRLARLTCGRYLMSRSKGTEAEAVEFVQAQKHWIDRSEIIATLKSPTGDTGLADFPSARDPVAEAFLLAEREYSVPARLVGMVDTPLSARVFANTQRVTAAQVEEHGRIPVIRGTWATTELRPKKFAGIIVTTQELIDNSSNAAQLALADDLVGATAEAINVGFLDPNEVGSVLNGAPTFTSAGATLPDVDEDLNELVELVAGASRPGCAFVMAKKTATYLATLRGSAGAAAFPNLGPAGGEMLGLPALITQACAITDSPWSAFIGLVNPGGILWNQGSVS